MWERWWQVLQRQLTGASAGPEEDPDVLLERAQEEMRLLHARNRERAVRAITQKNQLQQMVEETERQVQRLEQKADLALSRGEDVLARQLLEEKQNYEEMLELTRAQLEQAEETAQAVKQAIKREEGLIRQRTAHAMALQTQWRLVKIEQSITVSLAQISAAGSDGGRLTREQIQERHERNREYVAEAFTQKNELQQMVDGIEVQVASLREKSDLARQRGDDTLEHELLREMEQYEATLAQAREALNHAVAVTERARGLVQEESARVRALADSAPSASVTEVSPTLIPQRVVSGDAESDDLLPLLLAVMGLALLLCVALVWWLLRAGGG
jgi:phage shock protein A